MSYRDDEEFKEDDAEVDELGLEAELDDPLDDDLALDDDLEEEDDAEDDSLADLDGSEY